MIQERYITTLKCLESLITIISSLVDLQLYVILFWTSQKYYVIHSRSKNENINKKNYIVIISLNMQSKKFHFSTFSLTTKKTVVITGVSEVRYISKIKLNPKVLQEFLNYQNTEYLTTSFNIMLITSDNKVLLMQRSQSFHFPKVMEDLYYNNVNTKLLNSLYQSEIEHLGQVFFEYLPKPKTDLTFESRKIVHIFPGGHSLKNETIIKTLLRELYEETSIEINVKDLKFKETLIFNVLIYDSLIKKSFNNFVFPVKINMSSQEVSNKFKETIHTKNPIFINIKEYNNLYDAFLQVQNFILL